MKILSVDRNDENADWLHLLKRNKQKEIETNLKSEEKND